MIYGSLALSLFFSRINLSHLSLHVSFSVKSFKKPSILFSIFNILLYCDNFLSLSSCVFMYAVGCVCVIRYMRLQKNINLCLHDEGRTVHIRLL